MTFSGVKFTLLLLLFFVLFFSFKFQEEDNYLSYESFPVLCLDAASTLHRHPRSMFANRLLTAAVNVTTPSTSALACPGSTLIVRVRTERTNACATVSYSEVPYKLPTQPPTNKPTAKL